MVELFVLSQYLVGHLVLDRAWLQTIYHLENCNLQSQKGAQLNKEAIVY